MILANETYGSFSPIRRSLKYMSVTQAENTLKRYSFRYSKQIIIKNEKKFIYYMLIHFVVSNLTQDHEAHLPFHKK